jgi:hypothetical protein
VRIAAGIARPRTHPRGIEQQLRHLPHFAAGHAGEGAFAAQQRGAASAFGCGFRRRGREERIVVGEQGGEIVGLLACHELPRTRETESEHIADIAGVGMENPIHRPMMFPRGNKSNALTH